MGKERVLDPNQARVNRDRIYSKLLPVYNNAQQFVDANGINYADDFAGLEPVALMGLATRMLSTSSFVDAYGILADRLPNSESTYYDVTVGRPVLGPMYRALSQTIQDHESIKVERGLDIATGTGKGALILSQHVNHIVAIDASTALLKIADDNLSHLVSQNNQKYARSYEIRQMDALNLKFLPKEHFDIVTCMGLSNFLTNEELEVFYIQVGAVLVPGGRYYEPQTTQLYTAAKSPRGLLALVVGGIPAQLNTERVQNQDMIGFPNFKSIGLKIETVEPEIPNVGVLKLIKV